MKVPIDQGVPGYVMTTSQVKNILDAYQDPLFNSSNDKKTGYVTKCILCAPIRLSTTNSPVVGVIQLVNRSAGCINDVFDSDDIDMITQFTSLACPIITSSNAYLQLQVKNRHAAFKELKTSSSIDLSLGFIDETDGNDDNDKS